LGTHLRGAVDRKTVSRDHRENPVVRCGPGRLIPAAPSLRSDLPGEVTAQVTENVYDSPTGRYLLTPQGAKLIGT
jgi:type IV secretion system protein TrbI